MAPEAANNGVFQGKTVFCAHLGETPKNPFNVCGSSWVWRLKAYFAVGLWSFGVKIGLCFSHTPTESPFGACTHDQKESRYQGLMPVLWLCFGLRTNNPDPSQKQKQIVSAPHVFNQAQSTRSVKPLFAAIR